MAAARAGPGPECFEPVPLGAVLQRVERGRKVMEELGEWFQTKAETERRFGGAVTRLARRDLYRAEIAGSTAERALGLLKNYFLFTAQELDAFANAQDTQLPGPLEQFLARHTERNVKVQIRSQEAMHAVGRAAEALARAKKAFAIARTLLIDSQEVLLREHEAQLQRGTAELSTPPSPATMQAVLDNGQEQGRDQASLDGGKTEAGNLTAAAVAGESSGEGTAGGAGAAHDMARATKTEATDEKAGRAPGQADTEKDKKGNEANKAGDGDSDKDGNGDGDGDGIGDDESKLTAEERAERQRQRQVAADRARMQELRSNVGKCQDILRMRESQTQAARRELLLKIAERDQVLQEAGAVFRESEKERLTQLRETMQNLVALERIHLKARTRLLDDLERVVEAQDVEADLASFENDNAQPDTTHKYARALSLLDWDLNRRRTQFDMQETQRAAAARAAEAAAVEALAPSRASPTPSTSSSISAASATSDTAGAATPAEDEEEKQQQQQPLPEGGESSASDDATEKQQTQKQTSGSAETDSLSKASPPPPPTAATEHANSEPAQEEDEMHRLLRDEGARMVFSQLLDAIGHNSPQTAAVHQLARDVSDLGVQPATETRARADWITTFDNAPARRIFLQLLNAHRLYPQLDTDRFECLATMCCALLDVCNTGRFIRDAVNVANMANTFFRAPGGSDSDEADREYLQRKIVNHPVWRSARFWEDALLAGVSNEFDLHDPMNWDVLTPDALREAVLRVHNTVFGQLGSLALNMKELGISQQEVCKFIHAMADRSQLTNSLRQNVLESVGGDVTLPEQPAEDGLAADDASTVPSKKATTDASPPRQGGVDGSGSGATADVSAASSSSSSSEHNEATPVQKPSETDYDLL